MKWIRPILSLIGMIGVTWGFYADKISAEAYLGLVTAIVIWWFKSRDDEKNKRNGGRRTDGQRPELGG